MHPPPAMKEEPNTASTSDSLSAIHVRAPLLVMDRKCRTSTTAPQQDPPRAFVVYTCPQICQGLLLKMEIDPHELYNLDRALIYIYYCSLIETLFENIPHEKRAGLSPDNFILRLTDKGGFRKDFDVPFWGLSKAAKTRTYVCTTLEFSRNLIDLFLSEIARDQRNKSDSAAYLEIKAVLFHRCIQWEDIGQFKKVSKCQCGGTGCKMRAMNQLGKPEKKSPESENLVEPVISDDGVMWGWPEEERWYNLELSYQGQGKVVVSANIGIVADRVSIGISIGAQKKEFEEFRHELPILGVEVPPQLYCST